MPKNRRADSFHATVGRRRMASADEGFASDHPRRRRRRGTGAAPTCARATRRSACGAQALGFMPARKCGEDSSKAAQEDSEDVVRLYAIDSLGNARRRRLSPRREGVRRRQQPRREAAPAHATGRDGEPVSPAVVAQLSNWDATEIDTARMGQPAPDFELSSGPGGEQVRLRDFRGKKAVVLVFIYGDT